MESRSNMSDSLEEGRTKCQKVGDLQMGWRIGGLRRQKDGIKCQKGEEILA